MVDLEQSDATVLGFSTKYFPTTLDSKMANLENKVNPNTVLITGTYTWIQFQGDTSSYPANNYMFKGNNKTLEQGVIYVQSEQ